ncbi:HAD-IC family P-type ATPase [Patescibacteria group bacterium]|nr:HAD-IC family P-type ATPase [Patescibacteria group bacterium]
MLNYYNLKVEECLNVLKTSDKGLGKASISKRQSRHGANQLNLEKQEGSFTILWRQFSSPLMIILLIAGVASFLTGSNIDAGVILGAVFLNIAIGFFQEKKADNALRKLKEVIKPLALVLRSGRKVTIDSREIVPGDIMILRAGSYVPADGRLIRSYELELNEANLTGESSSVAKTVDVLDLDTALADRVNMVYAGSAIVGGSGLAVVTATGHQTELGKISLLVADANVSQTPLQKRLGVLSKFLAIMMVSVATLVVLIGLLQGRSFWEMFIVGISLAVAAIPEGLGVAVTVVLVTGMQQILKRKALVRKLLAAETLGTTTVICSDKTGTLTKGEMRAKSIWVDGSWRELKDIDVNQAWSHKALKSLFLSSVLCNKASIENPEEDQSKWKALGSSTETALLLAGMSVNFNPEKLKLDYHKLAEKSFNSRDKFMASLYTHEEKFIVFEKGAPEVVLAKCSYINNGNGAKEWSAEDKKIVLAEAEHFTKEGLRLIAVALREDIKHLDNSDKPDWQTLDSDLCFVGFIALSDPLRIDAKETVSLCRAAGLSVLLITGDHPLTALSIAAEAGLENNHQVITGPELNNISDEELRNTVTKYNIYARVSPEHKLRIVAALQANGEVVAMTGDGLNDSPALKTADIGVCLGSGTEIAKETADLVLLKNNLRVIVDAIAQGRIIFSNIRRIVIYLLSDCFSEVILIAGSVILGMPLALLPAQILWINIINDGLPGFVPAFEKARDKKISSKPIDRKEPILDRQAKAIIYGLGIVRDLILLGLFIWFYRQGEDIIYLRTLFFAIFGLKSLLSLFALRSLKEVFWKIPLKNNPYLIMSFLASLLLLVLAIYWSPLQVLLQTIELSVHAWLIAIGIAVVNLFLIEAVKKIFAPSK